MTQKHFIAIAKILNDSLTHERFIQNKSGQRVVESMANDLADYFASINPNFKRAKFLSACGLGD